MSLLSAQEQALFDWAKDALPDWYADDARANEFLAAAAKVLSLSQDQLNDWLVRQTRILDADGPTGTTPDWLNQHARDRGTSRRLDETSDSLRFRLRNIPDAVTRPALLAAITQVLADAGVVGAPGLVELPRDGAWIGPDTPATGAQGTFASLGGGDFSFTPDTPITFPPFDPVFPNIAFKTTFSGATAGGNNGTFVITGIVGNAWKYHNASGVAGADVAVAWSIQRYDAGGNAQGNRERTYCRRGYRSSSRLPTIVVILPFGTTDSTGRIVTEMLRHTKGAGVKLIVERRTSP